jgi:hypothetical protein
MIAGVQLSNGTRLWVDAGEHRPRPMDRITVLIDGETHEATVFAAPDQLSPTNLDPAGTIVSVMGAKQATEPTGLPGAAMPPLGSRVRWQGQQAMVTAIDPIAQTVTIDVSGESTVLGIHEVAEE